MCKTGMGGWGNRHESGTGFDKKGQVQVPVEETFSRSTGPRKPFQFYTGNNCPARISQVPRILQVVTDSRQYF